MECPEDIKTTIRSILDSPEKRSECIYILAVQREYNKELGKIIWNTPGLVAQLILEIISVYPHLASMAASPSTSPFSLSKSLSVRVTNVLSLLQVLPADCDVRGYYLKANIPMYLFPFLYTNNQCPDCENFKLSALASIAYLCTSDDDRHGAIDYLIENDFVPLCLRILKFGKKYCKLLSAFILNRIVSMSQETSTIFSQSENTKSLISVFNQNIIDISENFYKHLSDNLVEAYRGILTKSRDAKIILASSHHDAMNSKKTSIMDINIDVQAYDEKYRSLVRDLQTIIREASR